MSLKRVLWLLWFFLIFVDVAQAAPAIGAIVAAAKAIFTVASIVKLAIGAAINIGLSMYQRAKARKEAKKNQQQSSGVTLSIQMGESLSRSYLMGTVATAGRRAYIGSWGSESNTPNAYVTEVIEISCLPSYAGPQGLESAWFGDTLGTIIWSQPHPDGRGYPVEQFRKAGTDYLWVKYLDGSQTAADPFLLSRFAGRTERPYKDTMIGRGCQIVILTARRHEELFRNGFPQGLYQPKPMRLYDVRKDSSVGGNGAHRWADPSTWESSNNLQQMIYNVARGIYYNGRWVHGGRNFSSFRFPVSSWIAALNEADRDMGNGRRQFRGGMEVFVERDGLDVIEDFRLGSNARLAEVGGRIKVLAGAPGAAVYSFTDTEIVITSDQNLEPFPTIAATHNTITGVYPEPAQRWTDKDAPEQKSQALIDRDGGERLAVSLRFDAVPFSAQVQSLTSTMILEEQRWRVHDLVLPPNAAALEPNDVVAFSSVENSYVNKKFLIDRAIALPGRLQRVIIKEIDPSDYDPPSIIVPPVIGWMGPVTEPPQPMYGWQVFPATLPDAAGNPVAPSIEVRAAPNQDDVKAVRVQVKLTSSGETVFDSGDGITYEAPFKWVLNGVFARNADYQARGKFVPISNRQTEWGGWLAVRTPVINNSDITIGLGQVRNDVNERLKELQAGIDAIAQRVIELSDGFSLEGAVGFVERKVLRKQVGNAFGEVAEETRIRIAQGEALTQQIQTVSSGVNDAKTQIGDERTARTTADTAIGERVGIVETSVGSANSRITSVETAMVDGDNALAQSIDSVRAEMGDVLADGYLSFTAQTSGGTLSKVEMGVRAQKGDMTALAAMIMRVIEEGGVLKSENLHVANRTIFVDENGQNGQAIATFGPEGLTLAVVNVDRIKTGLIGGDNGKMVINVKAGTIVISS